VATQAKPIPEGYHTVTPYLVVDGAEKIIAFMKDAFGAKSQFGPMKRPDGKVMHVPTATNGPRPTPPCSTSTSPMSTRCIRKR